METEDIRRSFKPARVRALFVGESPPDSGQFFYAGNTQMARNMARAFGNPLDFLNWFRDRGCYLDDLVLHPVNKLTRAERQAAHAEAVPALAARVRDYDPLVVITVLKSIGLPVGEALRLAGYSGPHHVVAFPGFGQQGVFHRAMQEIIPTLPLAL